MNIIIMGARERAEAEHDKQEVESLIRRLSQQYGGSLHIISVGCDKGVGKFTRDFCMANGIIFAEPRMKLEGKNIPRAFFVHVFLARNAALLELGDEFYVFKGPNENGIVECIVPPAVRKVTDKRVFVYEYEG